MYSSLCPVIFITDDVALNFFSSESDCLGTDKTVRDLTKAEGKLELIKKYIEVMDKK